MSHLYQFEFLQQINKSCGMPKNKNTMKGIETITVSGRRYDNDNTCLEYAWLHFCIDACTLVLHAHMLHVFTYE